MAIWLAVGPPPRAGAGEGPDCCRTPSFSNVILQRETYLNDHYQEPLAILQDN